MYRSAKTTTDRFMSGDGSIEELEVIETEEQKNWVSCESQSGSIHGELDSIASVDDSSTSPQHEEEEEAPEFEEEAQEAPIQTLETILPEITAKELLNLPQEPGAAWSLLVKRYPEQRTNEDWEKMRALTFVPSNRFKLEEVGTRKPQGEDGLFVGSPLPVATGNVNRLKERIYKESGNESAWFSGDANLVISDPYRPYPLQRLHDMEEMMRRIVTFRPAEVSQIEHLQHRQLDPYSKYELTVEVGTVRFQHHWLFSKEDVLAEKLRNAFNVYLKRLEDDWSERCEQKLRAVRDTCRHTKEMASTTEDASVRSNLEKRVAKYRREMANLREDRDESLLSDKMVFTSVLDIWKQIKELRNEQQYVNTGLQLKILTLEVDKEKDIATWEEELEAEFQDISEAFQDEFDRQMRIYRRRMRRWSKGRRVPAEKPYEIANGESTESESVSTAKPSPPSPFHEVKVRAEIHKRFSDLKRMPGEPKMILELGVTSITPQSDLPSKASAEIRRRKAVQSLRLRFRIWFNMKTSFPSDKKLMNEDFTVPFNVSVRIPVTEVPECLHLELREEGRTLNVIDFPIPNSTTSFDHSAPERLEFKATDEIIKSGHAGVGSGIKFKILSDEYEGIPVSGTVELQTGWTTDAGGHLLCPKTLDTRRPYDEENPPPKESGKCYSLERRHENAEVDPNDPRNAQLVGEPSKFFDGNKSTEFETSLSGAEFCDLSEIKNSKRLRLLFLRDQEVQEFKNMRMIPASEAEILPDVFEEYEKRLEAEKAKESGEIWKVEKEAEQFSEWDRLQPIRLMRNRLLESFETSAKQITFEDLVVEEQIPDIGTLGLNLMSLFQPRRPLRPLRKERKRIQTTLLIHTEIQLVVNIVRAINLPLRKDSHEQTLNTEAITGVNLIKKGGGGTWVQGVVKPFVEVWFKRKVCRTTTALGPDPTWNQELQIPLMVENEDYSESIQRHLEEEIFLQVYDEVAIDLLEDERRRETDIHQRLEKRWLGCIKVPFATLYQSGRIEGTFRLSCPPVLLGYESKGSEGVGEAFLTLFITLQPTVTPPPVPQDVCSGTGESPEMLEHVKRWIKEIQKTGTVVRPFVLTPGGDTVLACRYLAPIEPPDDIFLEDATLLEKMEALAHYVSLFPSLRDASLNISQYTLWFTQDVFVNTPGGGREDHSVLLASFFLNLGVTTYIIQGASIPDGPTTHLLTSLKKDDESLPKFPLLWNPCSGSHTRASHSLSSLYKVWTAVGPLNMWGNVSAKIRPDELDWEIEKSKDWLPLFPKGISSSKLPRLIMEPISFLEADEVEGSRLGQRIERQLKEGFMKWRSSRTTWNRYSSTKLRSLLPLLEERRVENSPTLVHDEHFGELRDILKSYEMTGFPLHQPYSTLDSVIESVYSTGLHTIDTPDVEFALGVYAKAYPASIFSLWVYMAALHPIK